MHILELITHFEEIIAKRNSKRVKTENTLELIREQIFNLKMPHAPTRRIYLTLKENGCTFTYQYFMKLVESNWNTMVDEDGLCYIIVSSERNKLCRW